MASITQITEKDVEALQMPGRHDLNGTIIDGASTGRHLDLYAISSPNYQLTGMAVDRSTDISQAMVADSPENAKGYMITFQQLNGSDIAVHGLLPILNRTEMIALCERIAIHLDVGQSTEAILALKEKAVEVLAN